MRELMSCCLTLSLLALASPALAQDVIDHAPLDRLLKKHVNAKGQVGYAALRASEEDRATLSAYLEAVATAKVEAQSPKAKLAFYNNAYNALVIQAVLTAWPVESVMKVEGFFKETKHQVAGRELTLDALEHGVIRPEFKEPRVHFVLVCAAKSCPRLQRVAMTEANVTQVMERGAREFVNAASVVKADAVETSQLFNWFADDFKASAGSPAAYVARYLKDKEAAERLRAGKLKLTFSEYDWALNKK